MQGKTEEDREGEERESRAAFTDEFERSVEQASERLEEGLGFWSDRERSWQQCGWRDKEKEIERPLRLGKGNRETA